MILIVPFWSVRCEMEPAPPGERSLTETWIRRLEEYFIRTQGRIFSNREKVFISIRLKRLDIFHLFSFSSLNNLIINQAIFCYLKFIKPTYWRRQILWIFLTPESCFGQNIHFWWALWHPWSSSGRYESLLPAQQHVYVAPSLPAGLLVIWGHGVTFRPKTATCLCDF